MASEGWLTTAIIMLQQADRMRRTHRLNLAAKVFTAREKPVSTRTVVQTALFIATGSCDSLVLFDPTHPVGCRI